MFTIVIPLYNKELSIENTINSVLNQTYQDFEIIIVNDGSTDNGIKIIEAISDDRIKIIHQRNQGVSASRNCGIKAANNEWIALLDGDDLWKENHLEEVTKMMKLFPSEKIYATSFQYSDKRKVFRHAREEAIFEIKNYFQEAIKENLIWTSCVVIHTNCFDRVGFFDVELSHGEDRDLWTRLSREYKVIKSINITAIYNQSDKNSLTKLRAPYRSTIASKINLKNKKSYEREYLKNIIIVRLKKDIRAFEIKSVIKSVLKHNIELFK